MTAALKPPYVKTTAAELQPGDTWSVRRDRDSYIDTSTVDLIVVRVESAAERPGHVIVTTRRGGDNYQHGQFYKTDHPFIVRREQS